MDPMWGEYKMQDATGFMFAMTQWIENETRPLVLMNLDEDYFEIKGLE